MGGFAAEAARLPVSAALPALRAALRDPGLAALVAPPGAGKSTLVPLALMEEPWAEGRLLMLEPRRLAARATAERMAATLGEAPGARIGWRVRGEARPGARIEVVTEGILTRMLQSDPSLAGVSALIFDEFHERSIHADLGLALALEARAALRPDLRLLVMSATLAAEPVAALMGGAPIVRAEGRMFPVETRRIGRGAGRIEEAAAEAARLALREIEGDVLVFLPGAAEIGRAARALAGAEAAVLPLHGALPFAAQQAALGPAAGRKIVLATAIAETSLTVEGVRAVVDSGLARRARFDPGSGMARLVTERAAKAEADQRRGRAGRLAPGLCLRLWTEGEEAAMADFAPPEILTADLAPLALDLAAWGAAPADLAFLTPPPEGAMAAARRLLGDLGALDGAGRVTPHGRALAAAPAHPRLAHMILTAPEEARGGAARLAALLEDRDPLRSAGADVALRLEALRAPARHGPAEGALRRIGAEAARLARRFGAEGGAATPGPLLARAFPDRIAMRRPGAGPNGEARHLLSGGKGAFLPAGESLAAEPFLVAADLDGDATEARIRLAARIDRAEIETLFADRITWAATCDWSRRERRVRARRRLMLGALALEERPWPDAPPEALAAAALEGVRALGLQTLGWTEAARGLAARAEWARARGASLPAMDEPALLAEAEAWLLPFLGEARSAEAFARLDPLHALEFRLGREGLAALARLAPATFRAPTGTETRIDYASGRPVVSIRLQQMFGTARHPEVSGEPILFELLSPAARPVATTADLPGFWAGAYADVRKDLRGRYPKHPWPEDPANAEPTARAKPRGR